jgi:Ca-activated chloride channel family protein
MKKKSVLPPILMASLSVAMAQEAPVKSLNQYIEFLSNSTQVVVSRFEMVRGYQEDVVQYRKNPGSDLRLPSSGPLEAYYYQKSLTATGITPAEKTSLNASTNVVWELVTKLDETAKMLETHVRLNAYKNDNLKQSSLHIAEMQSIITQFSSEKNAFYKQIQHIYRKYQPYTASDPYLATEMEMGQALSSQRQLLDSLPYYLHEESQFEWPVALVQKSLLADEQLISTFGKMQAKLAYPASAVIPDFKVALSAMQSLKRRALDDHTFTARQSAKHGNEVYLALLKQYNQDLLVTQKSFVNYSQSARKLLYEVAYSPVIAPEPSSANIRPISRSPHFEDKPVQTFNTIRSKVPAKTATINALNGYVAFINESLRQMHLLQLLVRNYQSSTEYYRDPENANKRAILSYRHDDYKMPVSEYALLTSNSTSLPEPYRKAVTVQAEVLMNILKEMDGLSIELISYTAQKQYLQDNLRHSDAILDRYAELFSILDNKKERLYNDLRRIHESYPNATPTDSWYVAGNALLKTMDDDREILFGVRDYFAGKKDQTPDTKKLESGAQQLITDEYKNLKGLQRYGRSNGLCPYSPYEDLAANSLRFAEKVGKTQTVTTGSSAHPFESFYYFYNNELVYQYNKFIELSKAGLLKTINQPDLFVFRRLSSQKPAETKPSRKQPGQTRQDQRTEPAADIFHKEESPLTRTEKQTAANAGQTAQAQHDTVYVERLRVDTVYVDRNAGLQQVTRSLDGFATNNMVLLLDVSSSMNSPQKMPLLKRSIKSLLTLLRKEDQISIVLYSGKARVVLKPTSGSKSAEIARMIDLLQSDGDTDGNEGIKLAYKTANKSYIRGGNNRIVLATDGEFPVSDEVFDMIGANARQDVYLTVFTFGKNEHMGQKLKKLSQAGQGTYAHVTEASADLQLILEAQAKKQLK